MALQDVAFLPNQASAYNKFQKNCSRCENLSIATCLRTVVRGKQGDAPGKELSLL